MAISNYMLIAEHRATPGRGEARHATSHRLLSDARRNINASPTVPYAGFPPADAMIAIPPVLSRLAAALGAALEHGGVPAIDDAIVDLALHRHEVGPLLYGAAKASGAAISPAALRRLEQSYHYSRHRQCQVAAQLNRVAPLLDGAGIPWMVLKGEPQARLLYRDPAWRFSADIDLLVAPQHFPAALACLEAAGFIASNPPFPAKGPLRHLLLALIRDAELVSRHDYTCKVELHQRLFFAGGPARLTQGATPHVPALDADLLVYLVAHGAVTGWTRLKWLVDIVPLLAVLPDGEKGAAIARAEEAGVPSSFAAGLLLLAAVFPYARLGPLAEWCNARSLEGLVQRRLASYREALCGGNRPLSRWSGLAHYWQFCETASGRFGLLAAPLSSAARAAAAALAPEQRALTTLEGNPAFSGRRMMED